MPGGGGTTTTSTMMPWSAYVPPEVYSAFKAVLPQLQAKYDVGLTDAEKSFYSGQIETDIANRQKASRKALTEDLARSGIGPRTGAAAESYSDLARSGLMAESNALNALQGLDINRKDANTDRLLRMLMSGYSPIQSGSTTKKDDSIGDMIGGGVGIVSGLASLASFL